jgi:PAS domain-containing protein
LKSFAALMRAFAAQRHASGDAVPLSARDLYAAAMDATAILDAASGVIVDVNPAAVTLLGAPRATLLGSRLAAILVAESASAFAEAAGRALADGRATRFRARTLDLRREFEVAVSSVRADSRAYQLVHLTPAGRASSVQAQASSTFELIGNAAESFLVTDPELRISYCNPAFARLTKLGSAALAHGEPLTRWLRLSAGALEQLAAQMAAREAVTVMPAVLIDAARTEHPVELHAVAVPDQDDPCFGFWIRARNPA